MAMAEKYSEWIALVARHCELISVLADSDVLHLNFLGSDHVVLNSSEAISDLLDKRSAIYSDRVRSLSCLSHPSVS